MQKAQKLISKLADHPNEVSIALYEELYLLNSELMKKEAPLTEDCAATLITALVAIPAAVGNLLPSDWILPELVRFIAPGGVRGSGLHHLAVATLLALLMASLLTTKTVRHLGRTLAPLILLGIFAPHASAQQLALGARPLGEGPDPPPPHPPPPLDGGESWPRDCQTPIPPYPPPLEADDDS